MEYKGPIKISKPKHYLLQCEWEDGFKAVIRLEDFRKDCPCAECTDAHGTKKDNLLSFPILSTIKPGQNELLSLKKVGNYAVQAAWADGHDTGIYTWQNLREIFEKHALSDVKIQELERKFG